MNGGEEEEATAVAQRQYFSRESAGWLKALNIQPLGALDTLCWDRRLRCFHTNILSLPTDDDVAQILPIREFLAAACGGFKIFIPHQIGHT